MGLDACLADCVACGTCCFSNLDDYVRVSGDDYARLGDHVDAFVVFSGNRAFMRMTGGHCAALGITGGEFPCSVYEHRPQVCRDLERGSRECRGELAEKSERPREALLALRRRPAGAPG